MISAEYGETLNPITGESEVHSGIDFVAEEGTEIYAAYKGMVVAAAFNGTMGNYVMIDHGNQIYTIYMHVSELKVSAGNEVVAGQVIASVGSSGLSTGPHLHFSVRKNGAYVSPWTYLPELEAQAPVCKSKCLFRIFT